jgi:uncharacterized protein YbaR (Trm112 family)
MTSLPIDQDLFDLLVCPLSRAPLKWCDGMLVSTDAATRLAYRVEAGVPVMLPDAGVAMDAEAWRQAMAGAGPVGAGAAAVRQRHGRA